MADPISGIPFTFHVTLVNSADPSDYVVDPTIEAGDFQISTEGSVLNNLTNLPIVEPAGSAFIRISLTAAEMTGENVAIFASDQAGSEWQDLAVTIQTITNGHAGDILDLMRGDIEETYVRTIIRRRGTGTVLLDKAITGSLLDPDATITTRDHP